MMFIGESDAIHCSCRGVGIDQDVIIPPDKAIPLVVQGDGTGRCGNVSVHSLLTICLVAHELIESIQSGLNGRQNMSFELAKGVLDRNQILSVTVFLEDLSIEAIQNAPTKDIGIMLRSHFSTRGIKAGRMVAEKFNGLLGSLTSLVDHLGALARAVCDFLVLVFDLGMQSLEDRQNLSREVLGGLDVQLALGLVIGSNVVKERSNTAYSSVEMVRFFEGVGEGLEDLLLVFGFGLLVLCDVGDVVLEITTHVFPRLQTLDQQTGGARCISIENIFTGVGADCIGSGGEVGGRH